MDIKQRQLLIRILKKMTQNPEYANAHGLRDVSTMKVSRQKTQLHPDSSQSSDHSYRPSSGQAKPE